MLAVLICYFVAIVFGNWRDRVVMYLLMYLYGREADTDHQNEADKKTEYILRSSPKSSTSKAKLQVWTILDGLWLILSSTYLLHVSLFVWLSAVVSSFFYFQVTWSHVM